MHLKHQGPKAQTNTCGLSLFQLPAYTPITQVACITDSEAPAGESFCEIGPVVSPLGAGLYLVEFIYGTIWCVEKQLT